MTYRSKSIEDEDLRISLGEWPRLTDFLHDARPDWTDLDACEAFDDFVGVRRQSEQEALFDEIEALPMEPWARSNLFAKLSSRGALPFHDAVAQSLATHMQHVAKVVTAELA